jgi:hypothetical protein
MQLGLQLLPLAAAILLVVPRRYAPIAFLAGAIFVPMGANFELGTINIFPLRVLILVGAARALIRSEFREFRFTRADQILVVFGIVCLASSVFHDEVSAAFVFRAGLSVDTLGVYFLFRGWVRSPEEFPFFARTLLFVLIPLACFMSIEKLTGKNLFHFVSGLALEPGIREGRLRARGPFRHPIVAGTVAAAWLPLVITLWGTHRKFVLIGSAAGFLAVVASASSGPLMTFAAAVGALYAWRFRSHLRKLLWAAVIGVLLLQLVMQSPIWHIMTRIDLVGGSTGWHRARLIDNAIRHWKEWVIGGTDRTRHWMPSGVTWSAEHTDITNNYLKMGVIGGLPLMLAFVALLVRCFRDLVSAMRVAPESPLDQRFLLWGLGASLFAHSVSMVGVSYFDQGVLAVFYSLLAMIVSISESLVRSQQFAPVQVADADRLGGSGVPVGMIRSSQA